MKACLIVLLFLVVPASSLAQELHLDCRLYWVSEACRKHLGVFFNGFSSGFQFKGIVSKETVPATAGEALHGTPLLHEIGTRDAEFILREIGTATEVEAHQLHLRPGQSAVLPFLDEVECSDGLSLPMGTEIQLQLQSTNVDQFQTKISCREFRLGNPDPKGPTCTWSSFVHPVTFREGTTLCLAGLIYENELTGRTDLKLSPWHEKLRNTQAADRFRELILVITPFQP